MPLIDEMEVLQTTPALKDLLLHYAEASLEDRESWHDRIMDVDGCASAELSRHYGELIAFGWLEQNTGATPALHPEAALGCYRATSSGRRAAKELEQTEEEEEAVLARTG